MTHPPDYHIHTRFSCDSETKIASACKAAIARGVREIAFTDHADFEPLDACCGYLRPAAYRAQIERCRRQYGDVLTIRAGIEIGELHVYRDQAAALLEAYDFDFVLGSLHWVDGWPAFDGKYFIEQTLEEGLRAYFEELARLAALADYDVLAHLDIVRRAVYRSFGLQEVDYTPYAETIRRALRSLIERGKGLEINTSNCRRGMGEPNPTLQVLRWYRELGGEILTFGSDAHAAEDIQSCFEVALGMARDAGFTRLATFEKRELGWIEI